MSKPKDESKKNEGHNGFVWSQRAQVIAALALAAAIALSRVATALASGGVGWGR